jgi:hypothetical protein
MQNHPSTGQGSGFRPSRAQRRQAAREGKKQHRHYHHRQHGQSTGRPEVFLVVEGVARGEAWVHLDSGDPVLCPIGEACEEHRHSHGDTHACGEPVSVLVSFFPGHVDEWGGPCCDRHAIERVSQFFTMGGQPHIGPGLREWLQGDRSMAFVVRPSGASDLGGDAA